MLFAVLRGADEHLDQVIVQAIEKLTLKGPLELGVFEIARVQVVVVGVNFGFDESRAENHLDAFSLHPRAERDQGMLVELELIEHMGEVVIRHPVILVQVRQRQIGRPKVLQGMD